MKSLFPHSSDNRRNSSDELCVSNRFHVIWLSNGRIYMNHDLLSVNGESVHNTKTTERLHEQNQNMTNDVKCVYIIEIIIIEIIILEV